MASKASMAKLDRTKRVDPSQADNYAELGRRLLQAGRLIVERGDAQHASALAILSVHAAIAYADAATIHSGGRKSTSGDHAATVRLLRAVLGTRLPQATERILARLLAEKDRFEYQGYLVTMREAAPVLERAGIFAAWAEGVLMAVRRSD
jgi:hypothetical protein